MAHFQETDAERTAEVLFARYLDTVTDIVQTGGWRRTRYIRLPDAIWGLHQRYDTHRDVEVEPPAILRDNSAALLAIKDRLWQNDPPLLTLCNTPREVFSTLLSLSAKHKISWTAIRIFDDDLADDVRFWQLFWESLRAPLHAFVRFVKSRTSQAAAQALLDDVLIRTVVPTGCDPGYSPPDLIVLIGTRHLTDRVAPAGGLNTEPLNPASVLLALAALDSQRCSNLHTALGNTRVICLNRDEPVEPVKSFDPASLRSLSEPDKEALFAFGVFRCGFTQQMAHLLLNDLFASSEKSERPRGIRVRQKLENMTKDGLLRYSQGVYWVPTHVRQALDRVLPRNMRDSNMRARVHFAAGLALAPYLVGSQVPSLAMDRAYELNNVREAQHHLEESLILTQSSGIAIPQIVNRADRALLNISRFAEPLDPATILRLARKVPAFAWRLAADLIESHLDVEQQFGPSDLIRLANVGLHVLRRPEHVPENLMAEATRLLERLFSNAVENAYQSWPPHEQLGAVTSWAVFRRLHNENDSFADELAARVLRLMAQKTDARLAWPDFFELEGDRCQSDAQAAEVYEYGVEYKPDWAQSWVKGIGAEVLARESSTGMAERIGALMTSDFDHIFESALSGLKRNLDKQLASMWVKNRWVSGVRFFLQTDRVGTRVTAVAKKYQFLLASLGIVDRHYGARSPKRAGHRQ